MSNIDQGTAVTTKPEHPALTFRRRLESRRDMFKDLLPPDVPFDRFIAATMAAIHQNPELLQIPQTSLFQALMKCARDGLVPDGEEAVIVPYGKPLATATATYIPMYQGYLRRFRRSGQFEYITADIVRKGDKFRSYIDENGPHFMHEPCWDESAPVEKAYAYATTKDGRYPLIAVVTLTDLNKARAMSRTKSEDGPWARHPEAMYRKTAIRRLAKYLPSVRDVLPDDDAPETPTPPATLAELPSTMDAGPALSIADGDGARGADSDAPATTEAPAAVSAPAAGRELRAT